MIKLRTRTIYSDEEFDRTRILHPVRFKMLQMYPRGNVKVFNVHINNRQLTFMLGVGWIYQ